MALQSSITANTSSNSAAIKTREILSSLIMTVINDEITSQSTRIDLDVRSFKAEFTFNADIKNTGSPVEIIQSDSSRVLLSDIEGALTDSGYKLSSKPIKSSRIGINDKVKLQLSWTNDS